jgi:hypothetical protein
MLLVGKPEGKDQYEHQDVGGIWMDLRERERMGLYGLDWSDSG